MGLGIRMVGELLMKQREYLLRSFIVTLSAPTQNSGTNTKAESNFGKDVVSIVSILVRGTYMGSSYYAPIQPKGIVNVFCRFGDFPMQLVLKASDENFVAKRSHKTQCLGVSGQADAIPLPTEGLEHFDSLKALDMSQATPDASPIERFFVMNQPHMHD